MSYKGKEECPVVPDYINAKPVRAIGKKAFFKKNIKGIVLPDTLREIKEEAFRECNLEAVELPQYIERIEKSAFELCKNLTSVTIKQNKTESNLKICEHAFYRTPYIISNKFVILGDILLAIDSSRINDGKARIPDGVRVISCGAMSYNWNVRRIEIPETVKRIDDRAFAGANRCEVVALDNSRNYIKMGEDIFGKVNYNWRNFPWRVVENELVSLEGGKSGWKTFKNFSINLMMHIREITLYVPQSNADKFWEEIKIIYLYDPHKGRKLIPYMKGETYYSLFKNCSLLKDKLQMAECILMNYMGGKEIMEDALLYLSEHINKAIEYAIVHNKKDTLLLYEKFALLKKKEDIENMEKPIFGWHVKFQGKVNLNLRHMKYLMEKYNNEAAEYLKKFLKLGK